ncbi:sensor histidine kinase [Dokdonella sp.]|uniref:sensor histidine kinase n=1 Tax=Dokdonella sp. TaxID=2291710 RepID=UPI00352799EA
MTTSPIGARQAAGDENLKMRSELQRLAEQQSRLFAQLQAGEDHFKQLARSVWRVQENERRRLARDLHDGIGQHLTALQHRLHGLSQNPGCSEDHRLQQAFTLCETAISEVRTLSRLLRPQILDDLGLEAALQWLARYSSEGSACMIEVDVGELPSKMDSDLSTLIFRVVQEALANALKHARAKNVVVRLTRRGNSLLLLVVDDGCGCDVEQALRRSSESESSGLASMRERVQLFGGQLELTSQPGEGLQMRARLPLDIGSGEP